MSFKKYSPKIWKQHKFRRFNSTYSTRLENTIVLMSGFGILPTESKRGFPELEKNLKLKLLRSSHTRITPKGKSESHQNRYTKVALSSGTLRDRQLITTLPQSQKPQRSYLFNLLDVWILIFLVALVRPHSFLGFIKSDNLEHRIGPFHVLRNTSLWPLTHRKLHLQGGLRDPQETRFLSILSSFDAKAGEAWPSPQACYVANKSAYKKWLCKAWTGIGLGEMSAQNSAQWLGQGLHRSWVACRHLAWCLQCPVVTKCNDIQAKALASHNQPAAFQVHIVQQIHTIPWGNGNCKRNFRALGLIQANQEKVRR